MLSFRGICMLNFPVQQDVLLPSRLSHGWLDRYVVKQEVLGALPLLQQFAFNFGKWFTYLRHRVA